jgi:predicted transcriptional regulator
MTTKERLHELVNELTEEEAARALEFVEQEHEDPLLRAIANAPEDDEPLTADDQEAIAEGRADISAGRLIPLEEIKRELGYESA